MNREWQGIDKLRLDKYYMVRGASLYTQTVLSEDQQGAGVGGCAAQQHLCLGGSFGLVSQFLFFKEFV